MRSGGKKRARRRPRRREGRWRSESVLEKEERKEAIDLGEGIDTSREGRKEGRK